MKIIADKNIPFLEGRLRDARLILLPASEITPDAVRDADGLIVRTRTRCDAELLQDSKVKAIATATIGTDHIDMEWCQSNGIAVSNAPGCNAPGVALYVWGSLLRQGFDPSRHTLGVIGCGNVGGIVAEWGERLGARVLVADPPRQERGMTDRNYVTHEYLLAQSDAVTLHTPLTFSGAHPTFHLINEESLRLLKPGAIFVNAARGEVAATDAICRAIESGRIGKAIIDTWEGEPHIDGRLLRLSDVATPHVAGYSVEGKQRATRMALEAIGEALNTKVDTDRLAPPYKSPSALSTDLILRAFDPAPLTGRLKASPSSFEELRNTYQLHREL